MRRIAITVALAITTLAPPAGAALFGLLGLGTLVEIDPSGGSATELGELQGGMTNRSFDLSARPGDTTGLYGISRNSFEGGNQLSRIDTATQNVTDLFTVSASDLGLTGGNPVVFEGISIDPNRPSKATLTGAVILGFSLAPLLVEVDLDTGAADAPVLLSTLVTDVTHDSHGNLFGLTLTDGSEGVGRIDPVTGSVSSVADGGYRAIAFDVTSGVLLATVGAPDFVGELLEIDPTTGESEVRGSIGLPGSVNALAFLVPEPGSALLLGLGLGGLACGRSTRARPTTD